MDTNIIETHITICKSQEKTPVILHNRSSIYKDIDNWLGRNRKYVEIHITADTTVSFDDETIYIEAHGSNFNHTAVFNSKQEYTKCIVLHTDFDKAVAGFCINISVGFKVIFSKYNLLMLKIQRPDFNES